MFDLTERLERQEEIEEYQLTRDDVELLFKSGVFAELFLGRKPGTSQTVEFDASDGFPAVTMTVKTRGEA